MENVTKKDNYLPVILIFLFSFFVNLIFAYLFYFKFHSTGLVLVTDSLSYLIKSLEITAGNFVPMRTHSIGWPLMVAPFFYFLGSASLFVNMVYAVFINTFIGALAVFPTFLIAKEFLSKNKALVAALISAVSFWFVYSSYEFFAEPIFTIFLLFAVYFIIKSRSNPKYIYFAAVLAGFSYWIRPNGIFVLIIVLLFSRRLPTAVCLTLIFFAVASPLLYQRYLYFGSPFYYGENSRYFAESYDQVWSSGGADTSLIYYLKTHSFTDYFNRFFVNGFMKAVGGYLVVSLPLTIFFLWGMATAVTNRKSWPLVVTVAVFVAGLTPIYAVYFTGRHLFATIPIVAILTTLGIANITEKISFKRIFYFIVMFTSASFFVFGVVKPQYYFVIKKSANAVDFGRWAAANIKGKIAVSLNGDYIMMNLSDTTVARRGLFDSIAPRSGIERIYPGLFTSAADLNRWLKENKVDYVVIDRDYEERVTLRPRIYTGKEIPHNWQKVYSNFDNNSSWAIDMYKIND